MAVLSTLQYIPSEVDTASTCLVQFIEARGPFNSSNSDAMRAEMSNISLAPTSQLTHDSHFSAPHSAADFMSVASSSVVVDVQVDHQHGRTPTDGEEVWFCSDCGNGPMGTWYSACPCCGHVFCGYCKKEEV